MFSGPLYELQPWSEPEPADWVPRASGRIVPWPAPQWVPPTATRPTPPVPFIDGPPAGDAAWPLDLIAAPLPSGQLADWMPGRPIPPPMAMDAPPEVEPPAPADLVPGTAALPARTSPISDFTPGGVAAGATPIAATPVPLVSAASAPPVAPLPVAGAAPAGNGVAPNVPEPPPARDGRGWDGAPPPPTPPRSFGANQFDLYRPVTVAMRWLWLVAICAIAAGAAAYLIASRQVPMYRAAATLLVNVREAPESSSRPDSATGQLLADTYSRLVGTAEVRARAAQRLGVPPGNLGSIGGAWVKDTQLITVTVTHPDAATTATVANEVGRVFGDFIAGLQTVQSEAAEDALTAQLNALDAEIAGFRQAMRQIGNDRTTPAEERIRQITQIGDELAIARGRQADVSGQLDRLKVQNAISPNTVALAAPADPPGRPFAPNVRSNVIIAALVGALIAGGIAALLEYLDDTVKTAEQVERATGLPTLGVIGRYNPRSRASGPLLMDSANTVGTESYRLLRSSVEFARASGPAVHSVVFASMLAGEGKSSTLANLAIAYAQTGQDVVMVDADMRRPSLAKLFDVPNVSGLSTLYLTEADPETVLFRTSVENLWVLPSGETPPNPAALLGSARTEEILAALERRADVVFLDSPPSLLTADATALARYTDGVVLIVDTTRLRAGMLAETARVFAQSGARVLGVVLNKVSRSSAGYGYGYYGYGYGYGYGKRGYGADGDKSKRRRLPIGRGEGDGGEA